MWFGFALVALTVFNVFLYWRLTNMHLSLLKNQYHTDESDAKSGLIYDFYKLTKEIEGYFSEPNDECLD